MSYVKPSVAKRGARRHARRVPAGRQLRMSPGERLLREIFTAPYVITRLPREQEQHAHEALAAVSTPAAPLSALLPAGTSPETAACLERGVALLDEHAPGWQDRISLSLLADETAADPRAALLADVRAWARDHEGDERSRWHLVAPMTDGELSAVIGPRVKTVNGALAKLRPVVDVAAAAS